VTHTLDFSGDFFLHDDPESIGPSERPLSLYQAIVSIEEGTWRDLARRVFRVAPGLLTPDMVFGRAVETDACGNPISPVDVWIDPEGCYMVIVHDPADR